MAKGSIAKDNVIAKISEAFGQDYVGVYDKKVYVFADDGGEKVQIAISMTCPKVPVGVVAAPAKDGIDFEDTSTPIIAPTAFEPAEISDDERANVAALMARLGL